MTGIINAQQLRRLREATEAQMLATVTVERPQPANQHTDALGNVTTPSELVYEGKARIRASGHVPAITEAAGNVGAESNAIVSLPFTAPRAHPLDIVTVTDGGDDATMTGRVFRVMAENVGRRVDRRLTVTENQNVTIPAASYEPPEMYAWR